MPLGLRLNRRRTNGQRGHAVSWLDLSDRSSLATASETAARSRMEPSVNRGGGLLLLVPTSSVLALASRFRNPLVKAAVAARALSVETELRSGPDEI